MNKMTCYKMKFSTPLHIRAHGVGYEKTDDIIHSDTIFGALMSLWHNFYDDDVEKLCVDPKFFVSSAFPFKKEIYFFPRPMVKIGKEGEEDLKIGKKLKKVNYISKSLFEKMLRGEELEFDENNTFQKGMFWFDNDELENKNILFSKREVPRVTIDRVKNTSDIFYFSEIVFQKDSGLFFLAKFKAEEIKNKFETVLRFLADEGIGGDKRLGKGMFDIDIDNSFQISFNKDESELINLSLYHPTEEEIDRGLLKNADYEFSVRKGWIHLPGAMYLRRQSIRMIKEGSVFKNIDKDKYIYGDCPLVLGQNINIGLQNNIYRYGMGFCLPIKRKPNYD